MVIQLVGAGLPRTGTSSLREALRHLLGAPVHHMSEAFAHPEQAAIWVRATGGEPPVWEEFLAGYAAGVDAPFSNCWRDLAAAYPDAPVLLSHRGDPEVWLRSMEATVLPRTREMLAGDDADPMVPLFRVLFRDVVTDLEDRGALVAGYERRLREVRAEVPSARLVEWQPEDGWGPLCDALDLPVPDRPFPHENSTADHAARHASRVRRDRERRTSSVRTARLVLHRVDAAEAGRVAERRPTGEDRWAADFPSDGEVRATTALLRRLADGGRVGPFGFYRVERAAGGLAVGGIGFKGDPVEGRVEVGYGLAPSARGHGYAAEALAAVVGLAAEHGVEVVVAATHPDNAASRRTLERAGFRHVGRDPGPEGEDRYERLTRESAGEPGAASR
ncbi:hypothetical protein GCM10027596_29650 [Nocardioides korecus]